MSTTRSKRWTMRSLRVSIAAKAAFVTAALGLFGRGADAVSAGGSHSCSVFDDGTVKCWGLNESGQLGLGDTTARGGSAAQMGDALEEVDLGAGFFAVGVSCGLDHSCAWTNGGRVKCWGGNAFGQLGYGDVTNRGDAALTMGDELPRVSLGQGVAATQVVAARHFTCVLLDDESVKCFGRNDWGQLGSGNSADNRGDGPDEMGDNLPVVQLAAAGADVTVSALDAYNGPCAIMQSSASVGVALKCWGPNGYGSLGLGDSYNRGDDEDEMGEYLPAVSLGTGAVPVQVHTGMDYVCVLLDGGSVKCWGRTPNGQCGSGEILTYGDDADEMGDNLPFVDLGTGRTAAALSAGEAHVCAVLDNDDVKCWGKGYYGQTGLESWHSIGQIPDQMGDNLAAIDLGIASGQASAATGNNRLLRGLQSSSSAAAAASSSVPVVTAGGQRSCAILDAGSVKCWGQGLYGALGLGDTTDRGGRVGSMGDSLPSLSLGTDKVAVAPSPATATDTVSPTPAPTLAPTPVPTRAATIVPTAAPMIATTPTPIRDTRAPIVASPAPTVEVTPAPSVALATSRGGFEGIADDVGVSVTQGIAIVAGVPLLAILMCCCFGYCLASKGKKKKSDEERYPAATGTRDGTRGPPGNSSAMGGSSVNGVVSRKSVYDRHAAQIAPASRSGSRHDSKVNSRAASFYGPDGAESLMSEEGLFYASRRPVAEKGDAIDAARGRGGAPDEEVYDERADTLDDVYSDSNVGTARSNSRKGFESAASTPRRIMAALTPIFSRKGSSSETPPDTWSRDYQVQHGEGSGSLTPDSHAPGSASYSHSRNASARSADMAPSS